MRRSWTDSILLRIAVGVLCIEAAGLGLLGWHYQRSVSNYFDSILTQKALTVGRLVNAGTFDLNFLLDPEVMRELVGEELIDGMVVTAEGTVVLALDRSLVGSRVTHLLNLPAADWPKNTRQGLVMPINGGSHLGALTPIGTGEGRSPFLYLYVEISREATELTKQEMSRLVIFGIAVTLGLTSLLLIVLFHTQVARPLSQAGRLIQHVEQGDFSSRITRLAGGELGDLQQGLNQMARRLEQMFADLQHKIGEVETARRELAAREAFQQQLLSHLPVGVVAEDDQGRLLFANAQAEHLLGFSAEECVGSDLTGRLSPEVREDWCRRRSDALCERRPVEIEEWRFPTEGSQDRVLTSSFVPLPGLSGEETHVLSIHQDITEQKQRQAEREQMQRKITESQRLESLGVLAGGIAHDFNNLLMAILGNTDLAKVGIAASSPVRTNLRAIEIAARRAAELCRQLLAYAGKGRFVLEAVDLRELVREMSEVMEVVVAKKGRNLFWTSLTTPRWSKGIPASCVR
ncbi:MAG TPA: PAS domain S-box protein [Acidobacteriota bacterium]|nr:PAS domain S-box protein [Acidobacteriota bacterium]